VQLNESLSRLAHHLFYVIPWPQRYEKTREKPNMLAFFPSALTKGQTLCERNNLTKL
jgi:hypothetical protein